MNHIENDKGELVIAVGAPCSVERVKVQYPKLINELNSLFFQSLCCYGRAIDEAIELIRSKGIRGRLETSSILRASHYGESKHPLVISIIEL